MLHAAFLRSQVAHARIKRIDVSRARQRPAWSRSTRPMISAPIGSPAPCWCRRRPIAGSVFNQRTQVPLAKDKVRHVGEPLAVVVAESRYLAEDALDDIAVELEPLPAVVDLEAGAPRRIGAGARRSRHQHLRACPPAQGRLPRAARERRTVILKRRFRYDHGTSSPIETRGVVAQWDARAKQLTIWDTTQAPVFIRNGLAAMLGLGERQVRVIAPFIGGGFGPKIMMFYPEEVLLPWIAMRLNRPVKWIEDRLEHFFATTHERGQIHDAEIALTRDGRILGIKDVFLHDARRLRPLRPHRADQQPVHLARSLRGADLLQRLHSRLHQPADRHALSRRRPPARRVRDGAAARLAAHELGIDRPRSAGAT